MNWIKRKYVYRRNLLISYIANKLPKRVAFYCAVRVVMHSTNFNDLHSITHTNSLPVSVVIKKYYDENNLG